MKLTLSFFRLFYLIRRGRNATFKHSLTNAISSSIHNYKFPNNGKRAAVCPLDKGKANQTVE